MKIRALGTGSPFCRHPIKPASFLIHTESVYICVGCPWTFPSQLERLEVPLSEVSMFIVLNPLPHQIQGMVEVANYFRGREDLPILSVPHRLVAALRERLECDLGFSLDESFRVRSVNKIEIRETYGNHSIQFVANFLDLNVPSYGLRIEEAGIFITGDTTLNEDWLFKEMRSDVILHSCIGGSSYGKFFSAASVEDLMALPMYLQSKIWVYGYDKYDLAEQPFPMMLVPPMSWIYDSGRRDKVLSKERYIRENAKKSP